MPSYAWIINKDHIDDGRAVGTIGPRWATDAQQGHLRNDRGMPFRMFDDDRHLYYEGKILSTDGGDDDDYADVEGFEPLDDFGMPNAGCTIIQYQNKNGKWEDL